MYDELLDHEIIPEIKRESSDELSVEELEQINDHDKNTESYRTKKGLDQQNLMIQSFFII